MQDRILSLLGLAAKAGKAVSGGFSAEEAVRKRKARLVILASEAKDNTSKKFVDKCSHYKIPCHVYSTKEELGRAVGKESRAVVAVTDSGFAAGLLRLLQAAEDSGGSG